MAVAYRTSGTPVEANSTSVTVNYTVAAGDTLYVVVATINGAPSGVTWNTTEALTMIGSQVRDAGGGRDMSVWRRVSPTAGTFDVVATQAASALIAAWPVSLTGVLTSGPEDGVVTDAEAPGDTTLDVSITSPVGDLAVVAAVSALGGLTHTVANGTERASPDTANCGFHWLDRAGTGGATTINSTFSGDPFGFVTVGFNVNPSAGTAYSMTAEHGAFGPSGQTYTLTGPDVNLSRGTVGGGSHRHNRIRIHV
jgi:hypothetical protein